MMASEQSSSQSSDWSIAGSSCDVNLGKLSFSAAWTNPGDCLKSLQKRSLPTLYSWLLLSVTLSPAASCSRRKDRDNEYCRRDLLSSQMICDVEKRGPGWRPLYWSYWKKVHRSRVWLVSRCCTCDNADHDDCSVFEHAKAVFRWAWFQLRWEIDSGNVTFRRWRSRKCWNTVTLLPLSWERGYAMLVLVVKHDDLTALSIIDETLFPRFYCVSIVVF